MWSRGSVLESSNSSVKELESTWSVFHRLSKISKHQFNLNEPAHGPVVNGKSLNMNYTTINGLIIFYDYYLIMKEA